MKYLLLSLFFFSFFRANSQAINYGNFTKDTIQDVNGEKRQILNITDEPQSLIYFWASWCAPCLESMQIIKSYIKEKAAGRVEIITICEDNNKTVDKYYYESRTKYHYMFDRNSHIFKKYKFSTVPTLIFLDNKNKKLSILEGKKVSKELLDSFFKTGKAEGVTDTVAKSLTVDDVLKFFNPPSSEIYSVNEFSGFLNAPSFIQYYDDKFAFRRVTMVNFPLEGAYRFVYNVNAPRIKLGTSKFYKESWNLNKCFDVIVPKLDDENYTAVKDSLKTYLLKKYPKFHAVIKNMEFDSSYVLRKLNIKLNNNSVSPTEMYFNTRNFVGKGIKYKSFINFLENSLYVPVEDWTGDKNLHDIDFHFVNRDLQSLNKGLRNHNLVLEKKNKAKIKALFLYDEPIN